MKTITKSKKVSSKKVKSKKAPIKRKSLKFVGFESMEPVKQMVEYRPQGGLKNGQLGSLHKWDFGKGFMFLNFETGLVETNGQHEHYHSK